MKKSNKIILSFLLMVFFTQSSICQEISTIGEIYDFEIGDKFHYEEFGLYGWGVSGFMKKTIDTIIDKYYSSNGIMVYYETYRQVAEISEWDPYWTYDTTIFVQSYSHVDSLINDGNIDTVYTNPILYNDRIINYKKYGIVEVIKIKWVEGCGLTWHYWDDPEWGNNIESNLVYYKKGEEEWGTPVIILNTEENLFKSVELVLYPNPARDKFHIKHLPHIKILQINIYNQVGEMVISCSDYEDGMNISRLTPGLYIVEIVTNESRIKEKLIIQ